MTNETWDERLAKINPATRRVLAGRTYDGDSDAGVFDIHPTPAPWTHALLDDVDFHGSIWEPACGNGAMSKVIERAGYDVISTNYPHQGYGKKLDFLQSQDPLGDNIVTNPPYKYNSEFIVKAIDLMSMVDGKVAMLLATHALGGVARGRIWKEYRPISILVVSNSMPNPYTGHGYSFKHIWVVWDTTKKPRTTKIDWCEARRK